VVVSCTLRACQHTAKDEESAQDNHVFACIFAKYSLILIFFTLRLSNKRFLIWLLTTPLHLKYAATLASCRSWLVLLTLMFHRVVWQHMLGAVGFLICIKLQIYEAIFIEKKL